MKTTIYPSTELSCILQQESEISPDKCLNGVISATTRGFCFEEAVRSRRTKRNPKLFDGNYISLVHMTNGKYQCHMKTITASQGLNHRQLALNVYTELIDALEIIDRP